MQIREGYTDLAEDDFSAVAAATAAVVAEFVRDADGRLGLPFAPSAASTATPIPFAAAMGSRPADDAGAGDDAARGRTTSGGRRDGRVPWAAAASRRQLTPVTAVRRDRQLQPLVEPQPSQM